MKMNSDDKLNVLMAFKVSLLLYLSDLKTLIGVDLSAWTAAFDPSLLSDPPRVFTFSRPPTLNTGRPGISCPRPCRPRRRQALSAARCQGRSRAKCIGGGFRGGPRGSGSFCGGGSFHGGSSFRGGGFRGGSARAGRQDIREIDRAGFRLAEPLVCEPSTRAKGPRVQPPERVPW
jgi:hypothetical protein